MNGRIHSEETPEGRLAAVAASLALKMLADFEKTGEGPSAPDYADYRDALRPFVKRELILARIAEARKKHSAELTVRVRELAIELAECERQIPKEHRL